MSGEQDLSAKDPAAGPDALSATLEYLLEVRQQQLAEALSEAAHRGDRTWTHHLRDEVDETNRLLQMVRSQREQEPGTSRPSEGCAVARHDGENKAIQRLLDQSLESESKLKEIR